MKKMSKTAIRTENFRKVKNLLIEKYNAYSIDNEGAYFTMFIDYKDYTVQAELNRDCQFGSWDAITLGEGNWTDEERGKQAAASDLESAVDKDIELIKGEC